MRDTSPGLTMPPSNLVLFVTDWCELQHVVPAQRNLFGVPELAQLTEDLHLDASLCRRLVKPARFVSAVLHVREGGVIIYLATAEKRETPWQS